MTLSVVDLADVSGADRRLVGGKAGVLGELAGAGLPVPPGFVVTGAALADAGQFDGLLLEAARCTGGDRCRSCPAR
jgi:pyruvate,water dikinase